MDSVAPPESVGVHGERPLVPERVIVAPAEGRFRPVPPDDSGDGESGADIAEQQVIGFVESHNQTTPVRSPFRGQLMGTLAHAGERVREGQPVAWLRLA
jgi:biotin carboxyl carrier protein